MLLENNIYEKILIDEINLTLIRLMYISDSKQADFISKCLNETLNKVGKLKKKELNVKRSRQ